MKLVSSFIILLQQQQKNPINSRTEENLKVKIDTQEEDVESCYILFLSLSKHSNLLQLTRAQDTHPWPSPAKLRYLEIKGVTKPKHCLIRSRISESALQSVTVSLTILPSLSKASLIQATALSI